ncbi:Kielin/chordin-like protein [Amphibalanus amphitrite]|uniref:Kielin/chordin-like protein n=1 Tax=Amphibalanus amphitrite TaxID=1232801 RepID=A0A6A4X934_AMPAM|nr:Kielin/chordin-like protein [Amphibalanus amphitrite]
MRRLLYLLRLPTTPTTAATPTTTSAASVARWASHYYPCVDPNTGDVYQHGETRRDTELSCGFFLCSNGSWVFGGFHCPTPGSDPDLPDPDFPDPGAPDPDPLEPPVVIFPLPTSSAPPGATTLSPSLPTAVPTPSPEDGPWEPDSSCVDDFGQVQASGNTWLAPGQLCVYYRCQSGIISSFTKSCSPPPPGCVTGPVLPGKCCPSVSCPQSPRDCTFDDRTYRSGEVFADNPLHPCQQLRCDDGLVVSMGPPTFCLAVYCSQPEWPEGACCKTCPGGELPKELEELKQLVLRLGRRLNLPAELMSRLEESVNRLVAQLAALLRDSDDSVTLDTLLNNLIEMTDILNSLATGVADQSITLLEVLLGQLRVRLLAIVDQLRPSITDEQISNARIDIDEFVAWLRAVPSCTDAVGTVHPVDTLYVDNPEAPNTCFVCANLSSGVSPLAVMNISECGGPPPAGCTARLEPNSCCPRVSCSPGAAACRDDRGELHPHGSTFFDDPKYPCITFNCTDGVAAVVDKVSCMALPDGCSPWKMKGFCCPKSDCPAVECVHEGRRRDDGTTWPADPLRPCVVHTCLGGQVTSEDRSDQCLPPPASHCVPRLVDYRCCPQYDCVRVNCTYRGRVYREGETWSDDPQYPCRRYRCTRRGTERIQDQTVLCRGRPHAGCTGHRDIGQCCKQWICPRKDASAAVEIQNGLLELVWPVETGVTVQLTPQTTCPPVPAGCTPVYSGTTCCHVKYTCPFCMFDPQGNFIQMLVLSTPPPSPVSVVSRRHTNLRGQLQVSSCTAQNGRRYYESQRWWETTDRPCLHYVCRSSQKLLLENVTCPAIPDGCSAKTVFGRCCPEPTNCVSTTPPPVVPQTCTSTSGQIYLSGQSWSETDERPCLRYTCVAGESRLVQNITCDPLNPLCLGRIPLFGRCCDKPTRCGCVERTADGTSQVRQHDEVWTSDADPCVTKRCDEGRITEQRRSPQPQPCPAAPAAGCEQIPPPPGVCACPTYQCARICYSPGLHEGLCSPTRPPVPGHCCPVYECLKNCADQSGQPHQHGTSWEENCSIYSCDNGTATSSPKECPPPGDSQCRRTNPDECCPIYDCDCRDDLNRVHTDGSSWFVGCAQYRCSAGNIEPVTEPCPPAPHENCTAVYLKGDSDADGNVCCPIYDCAIPECVLGERSFDGCNHCQCLHPGKLICTENICTEKGCSIDTLTNGVETKEHGATWSSKENPCYEYTCQYGVIRNKVKQCPPKPGAHCTEKPITGICCPDWECPNSACPEGELTSPRSWQDDCNICTCTDSGVLCTDFDCHKKCEKDGDLYPTQEEIPATNQCEERICIDGVAVSVYESCNLPPANATCSAAEAFSGDCCPSWFCTGLEGVPSPCQPGQLYQGDQECMFCECVDAQGAEPAQMVCSKRDCVRAGCDDDGTYHEHGSVWISADPCKQYACVSGRTITMEVTCPSTPAGLYASA